MLSGDITVLFETQELHHEEEISRNPYILKSWINYLQYKKTGKPVSRYIIYERGLRFLPRSYKLWHAYLTERSKSLAKNPITSRGYSSLVDCFERALAHMNKMPRIWLDYCSILVKIQKGTETRRAFDRALQALPITQHKPIWDLYIQWAKDFGVAETAVRVYRRYLMFDPSHREGFVAYLESIGQYEEAAAQLSICVNDEHFVSPSSQTKHQMWMKLCDLCANHPDTVSNRIKVEAIIRSGIGRFTDEVGRLWCRLADFYVRQGQFEKARDIYEEGIGSVSTVKDFSLVFDSYVKVEESILTAKMRLANEEGEEEEGSDGDVEMRLARLEHLMEKRPVLLNSVVLRQNPHNVFEWHKRVKLFKNDPKHTLVTYMEAIKTVDPKIANGKLSGLWLAFARHYEKMADLDSARTVYSKAVQVNFRSVEELANVWCGWAELEMRHEEFDKALIVMQQAVASPNGAARKRRAAAEAIDDNKVDEGGLTSQDKVYKNVKVWSLYLDLEESLGSIEACKAAYDRCFELKVITPKMALNYATYLEERNFFEDSFRVYEQASALFTFPQLKIIWLTYLDKFMARYGGTKLERLRDLFEQALTNVPPEDAAEFYIKYGKAEESFGIARHAMAIYDRATRIVPDARRLDMYRLYVKKVEQYFGVTKTRPVYERGVAELNDEHSRELSLDFAETERKLGEVDRARAILQYGSQFADPRKHSHYWLRWREFEEAHGNEDTFRDMLRVQRSVETAFSQVNYLAAEMMAGEALANDVPGDIESLAKRAEHDAMMRTGSSSGNGAEAVGHKRLFVPASASSGAAAADDNMQVSKIQKLNPDDIDIDEL